MGPFSSKRGPLISRVALLLEMQNLGPHSRTPRMGIFTSSAKMHGHNRLKALHLHTSLNICPFLSLIISLSLSLSLTHNHKHISAEFPLCKALSFSSPVTPVCTSMYNSRCLQLWATLALQSSTIGLGGLCKLECLQRPAE